MDSEPALWEPAQLVTMLELLSRQRSLMLLMEDAEAEDDDDKLSLIANLPQLHQLTRV